MTRGPANKNSDLWGTSADTNSNVHCPIGHGAGLVQSPTA